MSVIKDLRIKNGYTQTELAKKLNVHQTAVSQWENGRTSPDKDILIKISELFGVSIDMLMQDYKNGNSDCTTSHEFYQYRPKRKIPILGRISAGFPLYASENIEGYVACDYPDSDCEHYFALKVRGDSMTAAGICDGDIVIIKQQDIVENGQIAVVRVNGDDATIKRFNQKNNTVILTPQSYNPSHQAQVYDIRQTPISIIGLAVECRKLL
jgi:SOS-response transcriptional repressors (RecA-mediated autopeptidases)